jgi:hypothetical protein
VPIISITKRIVLVFCLFSASLTSSGQNPPPGPGGPETGGPQKTRTLTGCLSKGDSEHEYKLTTANGGTWELHDKTDMLSPHSGQIVTVTGRVWNDELHGAKGETKDEMREHRNATEHGHLNVTKVSKVSDSCKK